MKRTLEVTQESVILLPEDVWQLIAHFCYHDVEQSILTLMQLNRWFNKAIGHEWSLQVERLRDHVIVTRLNAKYSQANEWFKCVECGRLYLDRKDHSHIEVVDNGVMPGDDICRHCIQVCHVCDQTYLLSSGSYHTYCGYEVSCSEDYEDNEYGYE